MFAKSQQAESAASVQIQLSFWKLFQMRKKIMRIAFSRKCKKYYVPISEHLFEYIGTQFPTFRYTVREDEFDYIVCIKWIY
jgi:hypothetical protein